MAPITLPRWKTLSRQDPEFRAYLDGTFSSDYMALPTRTLNSNSSQEEVTFEIKPVAEIERHSFIQQTLRLLRPMTLTLSVSPILISLLYMQAAGIAMRVDITLLTLLGVVWFHGALKLLNDYFDHIKGRDRINPRSGSRAIQLGWVPAYRVKQAGIGLLSVAVLLGLPSLLLHPSLLVVIALFALIAGLEFSSSSFGFKQRGVGELILFLLTGPFVSMGFTWAVATAPIPQEHWLPILLIGGAFGATTLFYYHLTKIEDILLDAQAGVRTLAVTLGFDRAKSLLWIFAAIIIVALLAMGIETQTLRLSLIVCVPFAVGLVLVGARVQHIRSPLSSDLLPMREWALRLHWLLLVLLTVVFA